jgi:hypothetical protein
MPICPIEEEGASGHVVDWRCFVMQDVVTKKGETKKKLHLVAKSTTSSELISYLKPKLSYFVRHNFTARWQDQQFKHCRKSFPADTIVSVIDFAENYSFEVQNEVQSMHWHSYQVTILVQITWMRDPSVDPNDEDNYTVMKYHFYISDDPTHDSAFVQHCLQLHWQYVVDSGVKPKQHWIWSDGCSSQFKSKVPWFFISRYPDITGGCACLWSFFGSGHGKGPHDGAGAVVKRFIRQVQLDSHGPVLHNALDVVALLREHLTTRPETSYTGDLKHVHRVFWHVGKDDTDRTNIITGDGIKGSRGLHSVRSVDCGDVNKLLKKNLACFCCFCMDGNYQACENIPWTEEWDVEVLNASSTAYVRRAMEANFHEDEWDAYGVDGDYLAACLQLGDNFAVNAEEGNDEDVDFYIVLCTKALFTATKSFKCKWGETFNVGDKVVAGKYYQKWGRSESNYVLLRKGETIHLLASCVRAIKFPMFPAQHRVSGNDPVYTLPSHAADGINQAIADLYGDEDD